jgi:glycogen debranching enzyme
VQAEVLAGLAVELCQPREAQRFEKAADKLTQAILSELWDDDRFVGLKAGECIRSESLIPCMPLVLGERLPEKIRNQLVKRARRHLTKWGLATELPDSPKYSPDGYWRGPIWGPSTVLICLGLERVGENKLARTVASRFAKLCTASHFAENFDALTGAPLRDPAYSWTASAFLFLATRSYQVNPVSASGSIKPPKKPSSSNA